METLPKVADRRDVMVFCTGIIVCNGLVTVSIVLALWCTYDSAGRSWVKMKRYQQSLKSRPPRQQHQKRCSGNNRRNWRQRYNTVYYPVMGALQRGPGGPWPSQNFGWVGHNAFGTTNNWPVCSLILHCGQLILRKISKIGASRYKILRLKCTKFTFCWSSAPDPAGGAYSSPDPASI